MWSRGLRFFVTVAVTVVLFVVSALCRAEERTSPMPTFSTNAQVVNLTVSVTDATGTHYLEDLGMRDFSVYEDGAPQELDPVLFGKDTLPISLVMLVDCSDSMREAFPLAQRAAVGFMKTLRPQDEARVVAFAKRSQIVQDFADDPALLERSAASLTVEGNTHLYDTLYQQLRALGSRFPNQERRRVALLLTDGEDIGSLSSDDDVLEAARASGIAVYAIWLPHDAEAPLRREEARKGFWFLQQLATRTGGTLTSLRAPEALPEACAAISRELRTQYHLGYHPRPAERPRTWRTVSVFVKRNDAVARHRAGYYAPTAPKPLLP
ncbi:MAG: VWA domain-containing protein [Candidatus Yanofskybacteria bacterium]|nr:VWA domain-containing protein [Candidatus Yanofskybacteria bacterium]